MKRFLKLSSIEEGKEIVKKFLDKIGWEEVDLFESVNRVLAEDVVAEIDVPPFDRALMDGYAVRSEDTYLADEDNPVILKVVGSIRAGDAPNTQVKSGEAVEIATGAPIPKGCDAVVMVEYTEREGDTVKIYQGVAPHENIQYCGSDIMAGEIVLRKGTLLSPRDIGALAAIGRRRVKVKKRLKVALISTGDELIDPGKPLEDYKIYDVNTYTLAASIRERGWDFKFYGIVRDREEDLVKTIKRAIEDNNDIVILSGGTSAGRGDLTANVIEKLGGEIYIHGMKIKPGKPTVIGSVPGRDGTPKLILGLPGYPTSCLTVFNVLFGGEERSIRGHFPLRYISAKGRVEYLPVSVVRGSKGYAVYPILKGSGAITSLTYSDGYVVIEESKEILEDEPVEVHLFGNIKFGLSIVGSHCIGVDIILREGNIYAKTINVGSIGGLLSIKRGEGDIAGIHLLGEDGEYNIPFLERYKVKDAVLVRGYIRRQGFMVRRDLPLKTLEDVLENIDTYKFINRNKGSGTRILFDKFLEERGIDRSKIKGYNIEAKTHSAVGMAVATGRVDIGVGIETVAERYNLRFIPIGEEYYDFLIRSEKLEDEDVIRFIETLKRVDLPFKKPSNCGEVIYRC
ncbi:MAG TPA: molybdopterin biosynthesis protein [Methanothermococcus okinawensis]|nr:molybdopterin biosynthesis protein [Methanothermococcus okinawensis]